MLNPSHFRQFVIRPTLKSLGGVLWTDAAEVLLLGTALVESDLTWLQQHPSGPALGLYQIEPSTHDDVWKNYLYMPRNRGLSECVQEFLVRDLTKSKYTSRHAQLIWNLAYATSIARIVYWRRPEPLPQYDDIVGLANYWKKYFNTHLGAGKIEHFVNKLERVL